MTNKNSQKTTRRETFKNPYEAGNNFVSKIKETAKDELSGDWRIAVAQMLGIENQAPGKDKSGELSEGEEVVFTKEKSWRLRRHTTIKEKFFISNKKGRKEKIQN